MESAARKAQRPDKSLWEAEGQHGSSGAPEGEGEKGEGGKAYR